MVNIDTFSRQHDCIFIVGPADDGATLSALPREAGLLDEFDIVVLSHRINELGSDLLIVLSLRLELGFDIAMSLLCLFYLLAELLDPQGMLVFCYILLHQIFLIMILQFLIVNCDFEHFAFVLALHDFVLNHDWVLERVVELADVLLQLRDLLLLL